MNSSDDSSPLWRLNHTELYQQCRRAGLIVHPASTRTELISYLTGEAEPPDLDEETHPVDSWRHGIIGFVEDHWAVLEPQLVCPAKDLRHPITPNPRPCFGCVDAQVFTCIVKNAGRNEHLINQHRPKGKKR